MTASSPRLVVTALTWHAFTPWKYTLNGPVFTTAHTLQVEDWDGGFQVGKYLDWGNAYLKTSVLSQKNAKKGVPSNRFNLTNYFREIANLDGTLLVHNRQIKMIGGATMNFNMSYERTASQGSRWVPQPGGIAEVMSRARKELYSSSGIIVGVSERFAETLCLLEVRFAVLPDAAVSTQFGPLLWLRYFMAHWSRLNGTNFIIPMQTRKMWRWQGLAVSQTARATPA